MNRHGRMRVVLVAVAVAVAVVATACSSSDSTTKPPTTKASKRTRVTQCARPHAAGQSEQTFTFQGKPRTYQLYVPREYKGTRNVPLVLNFHGFGSNAKEQMLYGDFRPEADRDNFLIVAPDGQVPDNRHYNLTREAGLQDDVTMVGALLDHLEATLCVNTKRVYSTGMSDGGAMTSVLACRMSDRIAAFATVALVLACPAPRPVPIIAFNGTADAVVPFNGGKVRCCGSPTLGSAPDAMASWAKVDHCSVKFRDQVLSSEVTRRRWPGCDRGKTPIFYVIKGGGHSWPGAIPIARLGMTTNQIDASVTIWKYFRSHTLS